MGLNHAVQEDLAEKNYMYRKLLDEHTKLDAQITKLSTAPSVSNERISSLKKLKLRVADKLSVIASQ